MSYRKAIGAIAVSVLTASANVGALRGQQPPGAQGDVHALLDEYQQAVARGNAAGSASAMNITRYLVHHGQHPPADIDVLLDGLESVALHGPESHARADAAMKVGIPGDSGVVEPHRGVFGRLKRIYERSDDPLVRLVVLKGMGDLGEHAEVIPFLKHVAGREMGGYPLEAEGALGALNRLGR